MAALLQCLGPFEEVDAHQGRFPAPPGELDLRRALRIDVKADINLEYPAAYPLALGVPGVLFR
jgi:hypothetical protein